ncbi:MAG: mandelate racemase/muconate lactonizing enzyme family protein [Chloroflexota bacterium]
MRIQDVVAYPLRIPHPAGEFAGAAGVARPAELANLPTDRSPAGRYHRVGAYPTVFSDAIETCLVRVTTDDGQYGWGEAQAPIVPEVVGILVERLLGPVLIGRDPFDRDVLWHEMFDTTRVRGHGAGFLLQAISALDIALWDLVGKATGQPVYQLLGGRYRDRVEVYRSGLPATTLEGRVDLARAAVKEGFRGIKVFLGHDPSTDLDNVRALRQAIGPRVRLMVDGHWMYDRQTALRLGRLYEREDVFWLEAPLDPADLRGHAELARALDLPIALGEVEQTRTQFLDLLQAGAVDVIQPDVGRAGGLTESRKIAALAETFGVPCAPHHGVGVGPLIAAGLHLAAAIPNFLLAEYQPQMHRTMATLVDEPPRLEDGFLRVPDRPGLGIDLVDVEEVERYVDWGERASGDRDRRREE